MRRSEFVNATAKAFAVATLAGCARGTTAGDIDSFMMKSRTLTGYSDLDSQLGATYLQIAGTSPSDKEILTLWYGGVNNSTTVTWVDALAWRACSFTKPPSQCAAPGSWHQKP